jgi:cell division septation protein DedD
LNSSDEAKELVNKLKSKGYDAYAVTGIAAAKGALHRVRIGSFSSLQEARQFAVDFEKKEKIKTIITSP